MLRRPLAFALAIALLPAAAQADDLLQSYNNARNSDPQFAAAESSRAVAAERPVQARAALLPQVGASAGWNRVGTPGDARRTGSWDVSASQSLFDYGNYTALRAAKAQDRAGAFDLEAAGQNLITRTSAAYFNVLVQLETLTAAEAACVGRIDRHCPDHGVAAVIGSRIAHALHIGRRLRGDAGAVGDPAAREFVAIVPGDAIERSLQRVGVAHRGGAQF